MLFQELPLFISLFQKLEIKYSKENSFRACIIALNEEQYVVVELGSLIKSKRKDLSKDMPIQ